MNYKQLTENERYQIDAMNKAGHSQKEIAEWLARRASTISRALRRNRGLRGYRPVEVLRANLPLDSPELGSHGMIGPSYRSRDDRL